MGSESIVGKGAAAKMFRARAGHNRPGLISLFFHFSSFESGFAKLIYHQPTGEGAMSIWELTPIDPNDANWRASSYIGRVIIRAQDEARAREIALQTFCIAPQHIPGADTPICTWDYEGKVACRRIEKSDHAEDGPEGILDPPKYDREWSHIRDSESGKK